MSQDTITVTKVRDIWVVKVSGDASFRYASPLRELVGKLRSEPFGGISFDMDGCNWMDSTFMGMVAMVALEADNHNMKPEIYHASDKVKHLLENLGVTELLSYQEGSLTIDLSLKVEPQAVATPTQIENAHNVIDAHKTLMQVDQANVARFTPVVDLVQKDLDKLEKKQESDS